MRKVLFAVLIGVGCWTGTSTKPAEPVVPAATGGATYGGHTYGGSTYGFASLTGTSDLEDTAIYGGLLGDPADPADLNGLGTTGTGAGGGGTGIGTIGTGSYGVIGHGGAGGTGSGYGVGRGSLRGRSSQPTARIGQPSTHGTLDPAIIRRYIRRALSRIRYCYEKGLLADPNLAGTVTSEFTIGGDGRVTTSTASGVAPAVAQCIARTVETIEFPSPKDHKPVTVRYPFVLSPDAASSP